MEYAGNVTQESNEQNKAITTCIYGWWKALWLYGFGEKPIFPFCKVINLFNYHGGC